MIWLTTRHSGAIQWLETMGYYNEGDVRKVKHFDPAVVSEGDTVIGVLPIALACEVCRRGGQYLSIVMNVPYELRGMELSADQMREFNARLVPYEVNGGE